eukprot:s352_g30.t2
MSGLRKLVSAIAASADWFSALELLEEAARWHVRLDAAVFNALAKVSKEWELSLYHLTWTRQCGVDWTARSLRSGCASGARWQQGMDLLTLFHPMHLRRELVAFGATSHQAASSDQWTIALSFWRCLETYYLEPSIVLCNTAINALSKMARWRRCLQVLQTGIESHMRPDLTTLSSSMCGWSESSELLQTFRHRSLTSNVYTHGALMNSLAQSAMCIRSKVNLTILNMFVSALEKGARWQHAVFTLQAAHCYRLATTDAITLNGAIMSCRQSKKWAEAVCLFSQGVLDGIEPTSITMNSLLTTYDLGSCWRQSMELLHCWHPPPDQDGQNAGLSACAKALMWRAGLEIAPRDEAGYGTLITMAPWNYGLWILEEMSPMKPFSYSYQSILSNMDSTSGIWAPGLLYRIADQVRLVTSKMNPSRSLFNGGSPGAVPTGSKGGKSRTPARRLIDLGTDMGDRAKRPTELKDLSLPLPRNEKGGILITEDELKVAWEFFDTNGKGKLTMSEIKKRLQTFYKDITTREVKFLLNNQPEITFDELFALLKDNQLTNFDPVKEAFKGKDAPAVLFRNSFQSGVFSVFYAIGRHPLYLWNASVRNGHVRRITDEDIGSAALEICGNNVSTTTVTCPEEDRQTLGIKLPFLVLLVKNMKRYFAFEVEVLDDTGQRRRFKASNFDTGTKVGPFNCSMPLNLEPGWNQVMFNLEDFTKRAFNSNYVETTRLTIHANCRLRRELPPDFRLVQPTRLAEAERVAHVAPQPTAEQEDSFQAALLTPTSTAPTESDLPQMLLKKMP